MDNPCETCEYYKYKVCYSEDEEGREVDWDAEWCEHPDSEGKCNYSPTPCPEFILKEV